MMCPGANLRSSASCIAGQIPARGLPSLERNPMNVGTISTPAGTGVPERKALPRCVGLIRPIQARRSTSCSPIYSWKVRRVLTRIAASVGA
jgi:hypothetical protein